MKQFEVGDVIRYDGAVKQWYEHPTDVTLGKEYTVIKCHDDGSIAFVDDIVELNYSASVYNQDTYQFSFVRKADAVSSPSMEPQKPSKRLVCVLGRLYEENALKAALEGLETYVVSEAV